MNKNHLLYQVPEYILPSIAEDGIVLFDRRDAKYHVLNGTASVIWQHVEAGLTHDELVAKAQVRYEGNQEQILRETNAFLKKALADGLLIMTAKT